MKPCRIGLTSLLASCAAFLSAGSALAEPDKEPDLSAKVQQLEKRVADLEQAIKEIRASSPKAPRTETENSLVGTWDVVDADKKQSTFTDMKLNGDGTCDVALNSDGRALPNGKYQVIGKQIVITAVLAVGGGTGTWEARVVSVSNTELVMEQKVGDGLVKVHYTREK